MTGFPDDGSPPSIALRPDLDWNRRSIRLGNLQRVLAVTVTSVVGCFGMGWYAMQGRAAGRPLAVATTVNRGDMVLPRLAPAPPAAPEPADEVAAVDLGPTVAERAQAPALSGELLPPRGSHAMAAPPVVATRPAGTVAQEPRPPTVIWRPMPEGSRAADGGGGAVEPGLVAPGFRPVRALRLPPSDFLLGKGTVVRCTLETAIDSELPGLAACVTGADVYGSNGRHILLARGTRLLGEVHNDLRAGRRRVLVIWVEARTPDGVLVPIASPATDELGRAGIAGEVDAHFMDRFGAALLISAIDAGLQGVANRHGGGTVVVSTQGTDSVLTEVLHDTVAIPPTVRIATGTPLTVVVAQDVDFGGVTNSTPAP